MQPLPLALALLLATAGQAQELPSPAQQAARVAAFQQQLNQEFSSPAESPLPTG